MTVEVVTPPVGLVVSLAEAKQHLLADDLDASAERDALITAQLEAASDHVEKITGRALLRQTWRYLRDGFPGSSCAITLSGGKVESVDSVKYIDSDGVEQVMDVADYLVDKASVPARIVPVYGKTWPTTRSEIHAVRVEYKVGWLNAAAVPSGLKAAILLLVGDLFENRTSKVIGMADNRTINALVFPWRLLSP